LSPGARRVLDPFAGALSPSKRNWTWASTALTVVSDPCIVYHGTGTTPDDFPLTIAKPGSVVQWLSAARLRDNAATDNQPAVLIADSDVFSQVGSVRDLPAHLVVVAADKRSAAALGDRADVSMVAADTATAKANLLDAACRLAESRFHASSLQRQVARADEEFRELSRIGMALMSERDRSALLRLIVTSGKSLTESDGAGLLLLRTDEDGIQRLYSVDYMVHTLPDLGLPEIKYPLDDLSIVGHAALTKQPVVVADSRTLPYEAAYVVSEEFQRRYRYPVISMLAVPMLSQRNELLGVLLFINRKSDPDAMIRSIRDADDYVLPYSEREVRLARSLASQAAVSIEIALLHEQVEGMLEGLVKASVSAIEIRDPSTAGHSIRVAALATGLAEVMDRASDGRFHDRKFTRAQMRELRFAALLHDLGKVAVRDDILVKAKKLSPLLWERVASRFELIRRTTQLDYCARRLELCSPRTEEWADGERLQRELVERLRELDQMWAVVRAANEPTLFDESANAALVDMAKRTFVRADGSSAPFLSPDELNFLRLTHGTLDRHERAEVESHVDRTYLFLSQVPWTEDLKDLATYAYGHHEKLNGTGYPRHLKGDDIPLQTRMITLADIFDALTEGDRPYKSAVTPERALDIIHEEARAGLLDRDLVQLMTESQIYRRILEKNWRQL
jgi:HD-GYP domain-containing protein (c-di-GMP phosphodiesterase class II)